MKPMRVFVAGLLLSGVLGGGESFGATAPQTTRTDSGGGVTIKVTYLESKGADDLRFRVVLDTHSVNLDSYDLKTISILRDDAGNTYFPTVVENKGSGHHWEAIVTFAKLSNSTKRVEIVIKDLAGVKERVFRWDLE